MADDSKDDDKEKLKKQIKALEDKIDNLQKPLPERHIEVLEENQKLFRDGVTTRLESMERTSKWFYKYFTFSALALIALGAIFVTIYVNTTSKKVAHEVTEIAEKKIKITLEFQDLYSKGAGEFLDGKYEKAIDSFNKALETKPDDEPAAFTYNYIGMANYKLDKFDEAIESHSEAIRLFPKYDVTYENRGFAYYDHGEYENAFKDFNRAAELYIIKGKYEEALINIEGTLLKLKETVIDADIKKSIKEKTEQLMEKLKKAMKK